MQLTTDEMYTALLNKDTQYEGLFFVGVKTTGIFCRPSCTARKPKKENVEFYESAKQALQNGYRPCKVCHPLEKKGDLPCFIKNLLEELENSPAMRISDYDLKKRGLDPNRVRRWFNKNYDMTFQAYQRMLRINNAFGNIRHGEKITRIAFDNGYDSLSGFNYSFKKATHVSPKESKSKKVITVTRLTTPLGPMLAGVSENKLYLLEFTDRRMLETQLSVLEKRLDAAIIPGNHPLFEKVKRQLDAYFNGERQDFDLPLDFPGTEFQKKVWQALIDIPYAETRSYKQQAISINQPKAVRAVGRANGENRIAIIIPCHRVIGENGRLTGYGGGIWRKQWLLHHEQKMAGKILL